MKRSIGSKIGRHRTGAVTFVLTGRNKDDRFSDAELLQVANHPEIESATLDGQAITKLPPFVAPRELVLQRLPELTSLAGIEAMVSLQRISLRGSLATAAATYERLAELPELVTLELELDPGASIPQAIGKLPSLITIELSCRAGSLETTIESFATIPTLRTLTIAAGGNALPTEIGKLAALERLEVRRASTKLPATIGKLRLLKQLAMRECKLTTLPDELFECLQLEVLELRGNPLQTLSPKIARLSKLQILDLGGTRIYKLPKQIGELANLRELRVTKKATDIPPEIFALRLETYDGPFDEKMTLRKPEIPEDSEVVLTDPARLPGSFGQPISLRLRWNGDNPPLVQLAACTQLRKLHANILDPSTVIPFLPATLVELDLGTHTPRARMTALPPLLELEVLRVNPGRLTEFSVAYPKLRVLEYRGYALPTGLEHTRLQELSLASCRMPDLRTLGGLPLREVSLGMQTLDLVALCDALAGKPLDWLGLVQTDIQTLPRSIGKLCVKQLDISGLGITAVPDEIGMISGLVKLRMQNIPFDKKILPGTWKLETKRAHEKTLVRTDVP